MELDPASGPRAIPPDVVAMALTNSVAFEVVALLQTIVAVVISLYFVAVFLVSPYPLQVGFESMMICLWRH